MFYILRRGLATCAFRATYMYMYIVYMLLWPSLKMQLLFFQKRPKIPNNMLQYAQTMLRNPPEKTEISVLGPDFAKYPNLYVPPGVAKRVHI